MQVHRFGVGLRQHQTNADLALRANGAKYVGPVTALVAQRRWTRAPFGPDVGQRALLADACLVLPPELDWLAAHLLRDGVGDQAGKVFLCVSWADASACGWRGRTEIRRKFSRRSSLPTLRSCRRTLNSATIFSRRSTRRQRTTPSVSNSGPA